MTHILGITENQNNARLRQNTPAVELTGGIEVESLFMTRVLRNASKWRNRESKLKPERTGRETKTNTAQEMESESKTELETASEREPETVSETETKTESDIKIRHQIKNRKKTRSGIEIRRGQGIEQKRKRKAKMQNIHQNVDWSMSRSK